MASEPATFLNAHISTTRTLAYRSRASLPYDLSAIKLDRPLVPDATVYIDNGKGKLPPAVVAHLADRHVLHCSVAVAELLAGAALLDPRHPGSTTARAAVVAVLDQAPADLIFEPSADAWAEAAVLAATLARTQGMGREAWRKLLNDALLFLGAAEQKAVLVSRNSRDMDLLLQLKPDADVVLYDLP